MCKLEIAQSIKEMNVKHNWSDPLEFFILSIPNLPGKATNFIFVSYEIKKSGLDYYPFLTILLVYSDILHSMELSL